MESEHVKLKITSPNMLALVRLDEAAENAAADFYRENPELEETLEGMLEEEIYPSIRAELWEEAAELSSIRNFDSPVFCAMRYEVKRVLKTATEEYISNADDFGNEYINVSEMEIKAHEMAVDAFIIESFEGFFKKHGDIYRSQNVFHAARTARKKIKNILKDSGWID